MMKILISRRFRLIKYFLVIAIFFMILNLRGTHRVSNQPDSLPNKTHTYTNIASSTSIFFHSKYSVDIRSLRQHFANSNSEQNIQNFHFIEHLIEQELTKSTGAPDDLGTGKYKPPSAKFLVILIQIHSRIKYLKELIESLRNTRHIEETLVIFSHDVYIEEMNDLISEIDFCATLQIFYPYSIQVYQNEFPGKDPNDCEKSLTKVQAIKAKCNNAYHADSFGHYREHNIVQIKHHWFWKISYVFEKLNATSQLDDMQVLLLEEDHFMMPDAIHVLRKLSAKILSEIDVVSLAYLNKLVQNLNFDKLNKYAKAIWHTSHHNTGLMIGKSQWNMIKDCLNAFCTYDDYNWDWTLQYLSQHCFKLPLVSIYPSSSRVIHIGQCGTHYKGKNCDPRSTVNSLNQAFSAKEKDFFPNMLRFEKVDTAIRAIKKSNGGWSDPRDHQLCKSFVHSDSTNLTKITL